jgi:hypothetical protein
MLLFAGPAHVGQSSTYRVTGTLSTQATPKVSTLILTWTAPTRLYARVANGESATAVSIVRDSDGILSVATPTATDAATAEVATLLNQLNFPSFVGARLNGSDHTQTTLSILPPAPAPASTSAPAPQRSPGPVPVPINVDLVSGSDDTTLIADGNSAKRNFSSGSGFGRRGGMGGMGGGMGGGRWPSRNGDQSGDGSMEPPPTPTSFVLEAEFDQSGSLQHARYRETFASTTKGTPAVEETFAIDRIENARQPN